jgi:branched-chain amino acid transport system substrate-binding protein
MTDKRIPILCLVAVVVVLGSLMLVGCGSAQTTSTAATTPATTAVTTATTAAQGGGTTTSVSSSETTSGPAAFDGEITIGGICSITGAAAITGAEQQWAQQKAIDDINATGGVNVAGKKMQLKIVLADDQTNIQEAATAAERLIKSDGLKLILGTQVTPLNMSAASVAETYQAFYHMTTTYTDLVRSTNFKWCTDLFFTPAAVGEVPFKMVELMPESERPKTWGLLTSNDPDGKGLGEGVKAMAEAHGVNLAVYEEFTQGMTDYTSSILKFKNAGVDALLCFVSPADGITFVRQMKQMNYSPKYMMGWKGFWPMDFMTALAPDSDYICHDGFWSETLPYPGAKELGQAFRDAHNGTDSVSIGLYYAAVQILATAIERAGSTDPAKVRDQVFNGKFPGTVIGDVQYDAKGVSDIPPLGLQWLNQKRVPCYPQSLATGTMEWFVPWDNR